MLWEMFAFFWRAYLYHFMNHISSELSGVFIDVTDIDIGLTFQFLNYSKAHR